MLSDINCPPAVSTLNPCMLFTLKMNVAFEVGPRALAQASLHVRICSWTVISVRRERYNDYFTTSDCEYSIFQLEVMQCGKSSVTLYRIVLLLHNWTSGCASRFHSVSHKFCHELNFPGMNSFDKGNTSECTEQRIQMLWQGLLYHRTTIKRSVTIHNNFIYVVCTQCTVKLSHYRHGQVLRDQQVGAPRISS